MVYKLDMCGLCYISRSNQSSFSRRMTYWIILELCLLCLLAVVSPDMVEGLGRPTLPMITVGDNSPQNPPKPYSFNYEVTDNDGNVHYHREQGDQAGTVTGTYGYMKADGLYRTVQYTADSGGYRAKVKTNEPGTKGPGSANVDLEADPAPVGLQEVFERKPSPVGPTLAPAPRPSYRPGMKG